MGRLIDETAIVDARALARHLASEASSIDALAAYDEERRPVTTDIVERNRLGGPERVIDMVEALAPHGFEDIDTIMTFAERRAVVSGYARATGFAPEKNRSV